MQVKLKYKLKIDRYRVYSSADSPFCLMVEDGTPMADVIRVEVEDENRGRVPVQELPKEDGNLPRRMRRLQNVLREEKKAERPKGGMV